MDAAHERVIATLPARSRALTQAAVGWDEHLHAVGDDPLHLLLVPVAGVSQHRGGCLADPGRVQVA